MTGSDTFAPVYDVTPFTLLDFPGRLAAILWIAGCNMRCPYCHNPDIALNRRGRIPATAVLDFLQSRQGRLDGVVLSGGEATAGRGIVALAHAIKALGFAIKLDTNGGRADIVRQLLDEGLIDRVALDYKAPPDKFRRVTRSKLWDNFEETLDLLLSQKAIPVDLRTTFVPGLLDKSDLDWIRNDLVRRGFSGTHIVQPFRAPPGGTLGERQNVKQAEILGSAL